MDASLVGASDVPKKLWAAPVAVIVATAGGAATEAAASEPTGNPNPNPNPKHLRWP